MITRDKAELWAWNEPVGFRWFLFRVGLVSLAVLVLVFLAGVILLGLTIWLIVSIPPSLTYLLLYLLVLLAIGACVYVGQYAWAAAYAFAKVDVFRAGMDVTPEMGARLIEDVNKLCKLIGEPPISKVQLGGSHDMMFSRRHKWKVCGPWQGVLVVSVPLLGACTRDRLLCHIAPQLLSYRRRHAPGIYWAACASAVLSLFRSTAFGFESMFRRPIAKDDPTITWVNNRIDLLQGLLGIENRAGLLEADRAVARVLGKDAYACELVRHAFVEWRFRLRERAVINELKRTRSSAPADLMETTIRLLAAPPLPEEVNAFRASIEFEGGNASHGDVPYLHDRIHSLGLTLDELIPSILEHEDADPETGAQGMALSHYFPDDAQRITSIFSAYWRDESAPWWEGHAEWREESHEMMIELDAMLARGEITPVVYAELAFFNRTLQHGFEATREEGLRIAEEFPTAAQIQADVGRHLILHGDELGIVYLERAMKLRPRTAPAHLATIMEFLGERGRRAEYLACESRRIAAEEALVSLDAERSNPGPDLVLEPPMINSYDKKLIVEIGRKAPWIGRIWVASRRFEDARGEGLHLVGVELVGKWRMFRKFLRFGHFVERDLVGARGLPEGDIFVMELSDARPHLQPKLKRVQNALVYDHARDGKAVAKK